MYFISSSVWSSSPSLVSDWRVSVKLLKCAKLRALPSARHALLPAFVPAQKQQRAFYHPLTLSADADPPHPKQCLSRTQKPLLSASLFSLSSKSVLVLRVVFALFSSPPLHRRSSFWADLTAFQRLREIIHMSASFLMSRGQKSKSHFHFTASIHGVSSAGVKKSDCTVMISSVM